jgi:hypothetical protein
MKQWTLSYSLGRQGTPRKYHVTCWTAPGWDLMKAHLFHFVFCKQLLGSWSGWTLLGDRRWWWTRSMSMSDEGREWLPLYVWGDMHCKLNTAQVRRDSVGFEITEDQYTKLGGTVESEPRGTEQDDQGKR